MSTKKSGNEKLDFEDEDARRERLGKLFADFSESNSNSSPSQSNETTGIELPKTEASRPFAVPESDVLARVRAFLPEFKSSTRALVNQASKDPSSVNLEKVQKGESAISMDLGLGVYDAPGVKGREGEMEGMGLGPVVDSAPVPSAQDEDEQDDDEEEDDDDDEEDEEDEDDEEDDEEDSEDEEDDGEEKDDKTSEKRRSDQVQSTSQS